MKIFAVDDEPKMLQTLHETIAQAAPDAEIYDFSRAHEVMEAIRRDGFSPDVVFSDIELPGTNGLSLAIQIKREAPEAQIIFVTGYSQYALEAFRMHARGYVMKPVSAADIREELDNLPLRAHSAEEKLQVRCFGNFDVFWQGQPLLFDRRQTKELFAYLIDRDGAVCTAEEVSSALWENETDLHAMKSRLRKLVADLKRTLHKIGQEELLIRRNGVIALRMELLECDYHRMLKGDIAAVNAFHGEYMNQYSWAEITEGMLTFRSS